MPCHPIQLEGGARGLVCTGRQKRKRCGSCGRPAGLLCDWKVKERKSGTCDEPICGACTHKPAKGKDLCPKHAAEWKARQVRKGLAG